MTFDTIVNPATNRKVSIFSTKGRSILRNYLKVQNGGADYTQHPGWVNPAATFGNQEPAKVVADQRRQSRCPDLLREHGAQACKEDKDCSYSPASVAGQTYVDRSGNKRVYKRTTNETCYKKQPKTRCSAINKNMDPEARKDACDQDPECELRANESKKEKREHPELTHRCYVRKKPSVSSRKPPGPCSSKYGKASQYYKENNSIDDEGCERDVNCVPRIHKKGDRGPKGQKYKSDLESCAAIPNEAVWGPALAKARKSNESGHGYHTRLQNYIQLHASKGKHVGEKHYIEHLERQRAKRRRRSQCRGKDRNDCKLPCYYREAIIEGKPKLNKKGEPKKDKDGNVQTYKRTMKAHCAPKIDPHTGRFTTEREHPTALVPYDSSSSSQSSYSDSGSPSSYINDDTESGLNDDLTDDDFESLNE